MGLKRGGVYRLIIRDDDDENSGFIELCSYHGQTHLVLKGIDEESDQFVFLEKIVSRKNLIALTLWCLRALLNPQTLEPLLKLNNFVPEEHDYEDIPF